MMLSMDASSPRSDVWTPATDEERKLVLDELQKIVTSSSFCNSRRYPALLRYVVEKTVAGDVEILKERTLGVEVFHRDLNYDTNADPVVRFTAGEVRKRLAQFYRDGNNQGPVEISLPVGSYVPQFHLRSTSQDPLGDSQKSADGMALQHTGATTSDQIISGESSGFSPQERMIHIKGSTLLTRVVWVVSLVFFLVLGFFAIQHRREAVTPIMEVWDPLLNYPDSVIISAGRPRTEQQESPESPDSSIAEHYLRPEEHFTLPTVSTISRVTGFLTSQHKDFSIREAYSTSLQDLHGRPVVLVTGNNNKWTLLLLQPLRFHFAHTSDLSLAYIEDSDHPTNHDWNIVFAQPYLKQHTDYAIVARFYDSTTGGPVLVVAGISSNGTDAAGQFIVSPEALNALSRLAPHGSLKQNFEAVLKVEVVDGNTGSYSIVATNFW